MGRYYEEIGGAFPDEVIAHAFEGARKQHPKYFPTLAEMEELCKIVEKNAGLRDRKALPAPQHGDEPLSQVARYSFRYYSWRDDGRPPIIGDPEFKAFCEWLDSQDIDDM